MPNSNVSEGHCLINHESTIILVDGGIKSNQPSSYKYDLESKTWDDKTLPLSRTRVDFDCGILDDILLVAGGTNDGDTEVLDLSKYWSSNEWVKGR